MDCKRRAILLPECENENSDPLTADTETPKALLNDVVLQNIFKYLSYKDLKSCREVQNRVWLRNSKKAWWSQTKIVFRKCDQLSEKIQAYLEETGITSNATNYRFEVFECGYERFLERLGPSIKHLEIGEGDISADAFRQLVYIKCPNVEKFVSQSFSVENYWRNRTAPPLKWEQPQFGQQRNLKFLAIAGLMPVSWMELLSHLPNLQALEAAVRNAVMFQVISIIRQRDPKMLKLKHINIYAGASRDLDEPMRSVYLDQSLSLETIRINAQYCRAETVEDILDLHAQSLKDLSVTGDFPEPLLLKLPRQSFPILQDLSLFCCLFPFEIFKLTPNVKKVSLCFSNIIENPPSTEPNLKLDACKYLELSAKNFLEDTRYSN